MTMQSSLHLSCSSYNANGGWLQFVSQQVVLTIVMEGWCTTCRYLQPHIELDIASHEARDTKIGYPTRIPTHTKSLHTSTSFIIETNLWSTIYGEGHDVRTHVRKPITTDMWNTYHGDWYDNYAIQSRYQHDGRWPLPQKSEGRAMSFANDHLDSSATSKKGAPDHT